MTWRADHLVQVTKTIFLVSGFVLGLEHFGMLARFENWGAQFFSAIQPLRDQGNLQIILITQEDYQAKDLFAGVSPLNPEILQKILKKISIGRPAVLAIDLDTSAESFRSMTLNISGTVIWAIDGELDKY